MIGSLVTFVAGGILGAIGMAFAAARGNEDLFVENERLERANAELRRVVKTISERQRERSRG